MRGLNTRLIHGENKDSSQNRIRSLKTPIYHTAAYDFENSDSIENAFKGNDDSFIYSRISNPTVRELEERLKSLAKSETSLCVSSGMAAISTTMLSVCDAGDNIITSKFLFGNTYSLFVNTFKSLGIQVRFVDLENTDEIHENIDNHTRAIFLEIITNPQLIIFDYEKISKIAHDNKVLLIVDNSLLTPYIFKSYNYGVDVEVLSTTKFISGGATSVGGAIFTYESDKWENIPKLEENYKVYGKEALHKKLTKEIYRNLGCCLSPQSAFLQLLGLETLTLRIDKICANTEIVANWLLVQDKIKKVEYSSLKTSGYHDLANKYFNQKAGCLISLTLKNKKHCFDFMDNLKIIKRGTNFCDNKSMIIHPSSTIYCDFMEDVKKSFKIFDNMLRLGVGLEDIDDLINDIKQSLDKLD